MLHVPVEPVRKYARLLEYLGLRVGAGPQGYRPLVDR